VVFHLEKEVSKLDLTRGTEPQSKLQRSISLNIFSHLRLHDRKKHPVSIAPVLLSEVLVVHYQVRSTRYHQPAY